MEFHTLVDSLWTTLFPVTCRTSISYNLISPLAFRFLVEIDLLHAINGLEGPLETGQLTEVYLTKVLDFDDISRSTSAIIVTE